VTLNHGQVLYLPAGNIHAYLDGLGIELMAASDNVLRGGLTPKHVDVPELLSVLDFTPVPVPYLAPTEVAFGVEVFRPGVPDFELLHVVTDATVELAASAIAICTAGAFTVAGLELTLGQSVFIDGESSVEITGDGDLFIATSAAVIA
jgi:mannose-6-phosphate isomerase